MDVTFQFGDHLNLYGFLLFVIGGFLTGRLFRNIGILKIIGLFFLLSFFTKALQATGYHWTALTPYIGFGLVGYFGWRRIADFFINISESIADFKYRITEPFKVREQEAQDFGDARARYEEEVRRTQSHSQNQHYEHEQREQSYRQKEEDLRRREQTQRQKEAEFEQKKRQHQSQGSQQSKQGPKPETTDERSAQEVLGLKDGFTKDDLVKAFREQRGRFHESKWINKPEHLQYYAQEELKRINRAYDELKGKI